MEILNVKVEKETKEKIERLVKARGYKNKSEALREIIEGHFEEHPELFATDDMKTIVNGSWYSLGNTTGATEAKNDRRPYEKWS